MREVEFERVDRRVDAELGDLARQHGRRVEVRERGGGRRVGQVVGRHVDRLHRGDRALLGGGDALLQRAHVGGEGGLVADRRRDAAQERRHLGARLGEAEDVVDEQQHVLAFLVAEIFREGEAREADAGARARRLVHLAVDQRRLGLAVGLDDARFHHLVVEVVALARALAHPGEHRVAAVRLRDVVDQLHDDDGLADAGTAEQADLAALGVGREKVDHLDACDQDLGFGRLVDEGGRGPVDRRGAGCLDRPALVYRLAHHVEDAAQRLGPDRHADRIAGVAHLLAADETVGRVHRDGAHGRFAEMLGDLEHQAPAVLAGDVQRVQDRRQLALEMDVDDGPGDLGDASDDVALLFGHGVSSVPRLPTAPRRRR